MKSDYESQMLLVDGFPTWFTGKREDINTVIEELPSDTSDWTREEMDRLGEEYNVGIEMYNNTERRMRPNIETQVAFKGDYDEGDDGSD